MKTMIYLLLMALLFIQCSNDDDTRAKVYFPKKITIEAINGTLNQNKKELNFNYSTINLITKIEFVYFGTVNVNSFKEIKIAYTANNDIKEIQTLSFDNLETSTTFNHDDFGVITQINFQSEEGNLEVNANYNTQSNLYTLDGSLAIFPLTFIFDNNDVIQSLGGPSIDNRIFNYNTQEKGLFKNLRQQPELIMWSEVFTFGSLNINLNYLVPYKLEKISFQSSNDYLFENLEIDNAGNLTKFIHSVFDEEIEYQYTISYENRNL